MATSVRQSEDFVRVGLGFIVRTQLSIEGLFLVFGSQALHMDVGSDKSYREGERWDRRRGVGERKGRNGSRELRPLPFNANGGNLSAFEPILLLVAHLRVILFLVALDNLWLSRGGRA